MPAYLQLIHRPACTCGHPATQTLRDTRNAVVGYYCDACAPQRLADYLADEQRHQTS